MMYTSPNDCFISSPSSPGLIFNRSHQGSRYHPYGRVSTPYHPSNELETYSFDSNNNNLHHHHSNIQSYDPSGMSYDYNLAWTTTSSSLENDLVIEGQVTHGSVVSGTGRVTVLQLLEYRKIFIHSKVLLVVLNDVYQLTKKSAVGHNRSTQPSPIYAPPFPTSNPTRNYRKSKRSN